MLLNQADQNILNPHANVSDFIQQDVKWDIAKLLQTLNDHQLIRNI